MDGEDWKHKPAPSRDITTVEEMLAMMERLDTIYDAMAKEWDKIQENLRNPWRQ